MHLVTPIMHTLTNHYTACNYMIIMCVPLVQFSESVTRAYSKNSAADDTLLLVTSRSSAQAMVTLVALVLAVQRSEFHECEQCVHGSFKVKDDTK